MSRHRYLVWPVGGAEDDATLLSAVGSYEAAEDWLRRRYRAGVAGATEPVDLLVRLDRPSAPIVRVTVRAIHCVLYRASKTPPGAPA